jgi:hypothetical protein
MEGPCVWRKTSAVLPFNPTLSAVTIDGAAEVRRSAGGSTVGSAAVIAPLAP